MASVFDDLEAGGESIIDQWITNRFPEGLYFDCKCRADGSKPQLSRDDRRSLGKSISAFANSEGGTLLWGVEARNENGIDGVIRKLPIADIDAFRSNAEQAISDLISPPVLGLRFLIVRASEDDRAGFLAIDVPASDARPHMSRGSGEHSFYFRNGHQSLPMEVFQVRDQMLRRTTASLEFKWDIRVAHEQLSLANTQTGQIPVSVELALENNSVVSARFPYLIIRFDCARYLGMGNAYSAYAKDGLPISRLGPIELKSIRVDHRSFSKDWEAAGGADCCIHPGTKMKIASIPLSAPATLTIKANQANGVLIPDFRHLQTILMDVTYGCQDSASKRASVELTGITMHAKLFENGLVGPIII